LEGFIVAFLNLDRVDGIRYDDEPKAALMRELGPRTLMRALDEAVMYPCAVENSLSEIQVDAILNQHACGHVATSGRAGIAARNSPR
jgi:topoisomerase-4 subunit A